MIRHAEKMRKAAARRHEAARREQLIEQGVELLVDRLGADDLRHLGEILAEIDLHKFRQAVLDAITELPVDEEPRVYKGLDNFKVALEAARQSPQKPAPVKPKVARVSDSSAE
jgi:hypothetical protein